MFLLSLQNAVPPATYRQAECWDILQSSQTFSGLQSRSQALLRRVLLSDNGIQTRSFAVEPVDSLFDLGPDALNAAFEKTAPDLGSSALKKAIQASGRTNRDVDALFVCTCTGYLCPGLSSHIAESIGLKPDAALFDLVGQGCGAALPTLSLADAWLSRNPAATIAVVAVEICSAAFYLDDDPGVLISLCLFGDGASASLWTGQPGTDTSLHLDHFRSLHLPAERELLRFRIRNGKLRNQLLPEVPEAAAKAVETLLANTLRDSAGKTGTLIPHPGGRLVLEAIQRRFPDQSCAASARVLARHGNLSSPSVLFALQDHLETEPADTGPFHLTSFGAGFTAFSATASRTNPA